MIYYQVNKRALSGVLVVCSLIKLEDNELEVTGVCSSIPFKQLNTFNSLSTGFCYS